MYKRSISDKRATYGSFTGKHIVQVQLTNIGDAESYADK